MSYTRTNIFENQISKSRNSYLVSDEYRTNPKSKREGGSVVKVVYTDGSARIYDKIKNTEAYISYIKNNSNVAIKDAFVM